MTPPGSARRPGRGPEGPWDPQNGGPDPHFGGPRCTNAPWGMVITRVTDYRGGACLARILSTLEDNVHLAHLWPGTGRAHLWAYTPVSYGVKPLDTQMCLRLRRHRLPAQTLLLEADTMRNSNSRNDGKASSPFFSGFRPPGAPIDH